MKEGLWVLMVLLMEDIRQNLLACIKPCKEWDELPINRCRISVSSNLQVEKNCKVGPYQYRAIYIYIYITPLIGQG